MSRAPFSPEQEIAAYRAAPPGTRVGVLTPEIAEFVQSGVAVIFGVHDSLCGPLSGLGLGARALPEGRLRVLMRRSGNDRLLLAMMRDSRIAATFSVPRTHRSIQLKGADAVISAAQDEDLRAAVAQTRNFIAELVACGYPESISSAFNTFDPADVVAVEFTPSAIFTQTPGPGAGGEVTP
jgi:hypothetical protein